MIGIIKMYGFYRFAACVPSVKVGDIAWNLKQILQLADSAGNTGCAAAAFPELSLTSASCGDLFRQPLLLKNAETAVMEFAENTKKFSTLFVLGVPVQSSGRIYNCAVFIQNGIVCGIVPKTFRQPDSPFAAAGGQEPPEIPFAGMNVPFGTDLILDSGNGDHQLSLQKAVLDGVTKFSASDVIEKYRLNSSANVRRVKDALRKKEIITFDEKDEPVILDPLFEYWVSKYYFEMQ